MFSELSKPYIINNLIAGKNGIDGNPICYSGTYSILLRMLENEGNLTILNEAAKNISGDKSWDEWVGYLSCCICNNWPPMQKPPIKYYRFGGFSALAALAKNKTPSFLDLVLWTPRLLIDIVCRDGTSGTILNWQIIKCLELKKIDFAVSLVKLWKWALERRFKNKMGDVFSIYFGEEHPFAIYTKGLI